MRVSSTHPRPRRKALAPPATAAAATAAAEVIAVEPADSARAAGLRYVSDTQPGLHRVRCGKGFRYTGPGGEPMRDKETLARIKSLVIPPAWKNVWICANPRGHLQATGRDARGRKQSRYHPQWRKVRDETKFERLTQFAAALPSLRERVHHDLALPGLPLEKILATLVRLMETTLIRVGNEEYARENHSYGLTTLRNKHVEVDGANVTFSFHGKSRVHHTINLRDRRLAHIIQRCADIPGYELFQYLDASGDPHPVDSSDVNDYLHQITGQHFTAKDFRTWAGSVLAAGMLQELGPCTSIADAKKNVVQTIAAVASRLGNTPAVCRKCYVHPTVLETYLAEPRPTIEQERSGQETARQEAAEQEGAESAHTLSSAEQTLLFLLDQGQRLKRAA